MKTILIIFIAVLGNSFAFASSDCFKVSSISQSAFPVAAEEDMILIESDKSLLYGVRTTNLIAYDLVRDALKGDLLVCPTIYSSTPGELTVLTQVRVERDL